MGQKTVHIMQKEQRTSSGTTSEVRKQQVLYAVFTAIMLLFLVSSGLGIYDSYQTSDWPVVTGSVDSGVGKDKSATTAALHTVGARTSVLYRYKYKGQEYSALHIFGGKNAEAAEFPNDGTVQVYVNPARPSESRLSRPAGDKMSIFACALFSLATLFGVGQLLTLSRKSKQDATPPSQVG